MELDGAGISYEWSWSIKSRFLFHLYLNSSSNYPDLFKEQHQKSSPLKSLKNQSALLAMSLLVESTQRFHNNNSLIFIYQLIISIDDKSNFQFKFALFIFLSFSPIHFSCGSYQFVLYIYELPSSYFQQVTSQ